MNANMKKSSHEKQKNRIWKQTTMQENPALQRYKTYQITSLVDTQITSSSIRLELDPGLQELQKGQGLTWKWKKRDARTDACEL